MTIREDFLETPPPANGCHNCPGEEETTVYPHNCPPTQDQPPYKLTTIPVSYQKFQESYLRGYGTALEMLAHVV
jgi:hypothetical protein